MLNSIELKFIDIVANTFKDKVADKDVEVMAEHISNIVDSVDDVEAFVERVVHHRARTYMKPIQQEHKPDRPKDALKTATDNATKIYEFLKDTDYFSINPNGKILKDMCEDFSKEPSKYIDTFGAFSTDKKTLAQELRSTFKNRTDQIAYFLQDLQ